MYKIRAVASEGGTSGAAALHPPPPLLDLLSQTTQACGWICFL